MIRGILSSELRVHRILLSHGLRVVCVPQPKLHSVCVSLHLHVGPRFETPENNGISHTLEHMLFRGTPAHPNAHSLALAVERLGATLFASTQTDNGTMSVTLPPQNLEQGLELFAQVITNPVFSDIEVERGILREEILEGLDEVGNSIDADDLNRALMFDPHPLGLPIVGRLNSVDTVTPEALRVHHNAFYTANNMVLSIAGPIDAAVCHELAQQHFASLPESPALVLSAPQEQQQPRTQFVNNQGSQTEVRVGFRAPSRQHPLHTATELLVRLLDDGMSTRLYAKVCDELGLCYDISADYEAFEDDGVLDFAATVRHDRAPVIVEQLIAIAKDLAEKGPSEDELQVAKNRHHWGVEAMLDHADGLADYHGLSELYGRAIPLRERCEQMQRITREQVIEAARAVFRPQYCSITTVGMLKRAHQKQIEQALKELKDLGGAGQRHSRDNLDTTL